MNGIQSASLQINYVGPNLKSIQEITPSGGSIAADNLNVAGGRKIIINSSAFFAGQTKVVVGGKDCAGVTDVTATSVTCTYPKHLPGTYTVTVNVNGVESINTLDVTYGNPVIAAASVPPPGLGTQGGQALTITGTNLAFPDDTNKNPTITVGGRPCEVTNTPSESEVVCTTPSGLDPSASVTVQVTLNGKASNHFPIGFGAPVITDISPMTDIATDGTTAIIITGSNFVPAMASVTIGDGKCTVDVGASSAAQLVCKAPALPPSAQAYDVVVRVAGRDSNNFKVNYATLRIESISPDVNLDNAGGTEVTISGAGFYPGCAVTVNSKECAVIGSITGNQVCCMQLQLLATNQGAALLDTLEVHSACST